MFEESSVAAEDGCAPLVLRVWLPDRPGALGAVATRIGAGATEP